MVAPDIPGGLTDEQSSPDALVHRIDAEKGSIRSVEDLRTFVSDVLIPRCPLGNAAVVPRGVIDRGTFDFGEMCIVNPTWQSASFHHHAKFETTLVPESPDVVVATVIAKARHVLDALRILLRDENDFDLAISTVPVALRDIAAAHLLESLQPVEADKDIERKFNEFRKFMQMVLSSGSYPFLRNIQMSLEDRIHPISWQEHDICMLAKGCVHARDIRKQYERQSETHMRCLKGVQGSRSRV